MFRKIPPPVLMIAVGFILLLAMLLSLRRLAFPNTARQVEEVNSAETNPAAQPQTTANQSQSGPLQHRVAAGETLTTIANVYGVTTDQLIATNNIANPNVIEVGLLLTIPGTGSSVAAVQSVDAPSERLLPDSELVFGPSMKGVAINDLIPQNSYLRTYSDVVEGRTLTGVEVVELVAERTRVNPRLLLAALEYRAGWVRTATPPLTNQPFGSIGSFGLYAQLESVANQFNFGYYGRADGGLTGTVLPDGQTIPFFNNINDGTAGVLQWLSSRPATNFDVWATEASPDGFMATYRDMYGDPFEREDRRFYPNNLNQPRMSVPWENGETWYFTGGPHGGWIAGSAWAALDFVPGEDQFGCYESEKWVTAVANGVVTRSDFGAVVLDLDGDGFAGTGWAVLYQHIATNDRAQVGTQLRRGDPLGHPSCEGGFSTGTHLHIARMYNGRWISADAGSTPFNLDGWVASGAGNEYNGTLNKGTRTLTASVGRLDNNALTAGE